MGIKSVTQIIGGCALYVVLLAASVGLVIAFIVGAAWLVQFVLPWLMLASIIVLGLCIFVLGPLAIIPATRPIAGVCYFIASYLFGLTGWFMGLLLAWMLWGLWAVIVGLVIFGVGVVPVAMLATLVNGRWWDLGFLLLAVVLTFGTRLLGAALAESERSGS